MLVGSRGVSRFYILILYARWGRGRGRGSFGPSGLSFGIEIT